MWRCELFKTTYQRKQQHVLSKLKVFVSTPTLIEDGPNRALVTTFSCTVYLSEVPYFTRTQEANVAVILNIQDA